MRQINSVNFYQHIKIRKISLISELIKEDPREIDEAIQFYPQLIQFLKQGTDEPALLEESIAALTSLTGNEE
ncbi:hypothetical protein [Bacillus subtilis]|uniref:hypothetical protein n=1 Tax=Bacillus subtilis TaxID=1423 RepID=UPI00345EBF12